MNTKIDYRNIGSGYPLGIRNNNPCNLKPSGWTYTGQVGKDRQGHAIFDNLQDGLNAGANDIAFKLYNRSPILDTITKFVNVYAPASDGNNTTAYINHLVKQTGLSATQKVPKDINVFTKFFNGVLIMEIGQKFMYLLPETNKKNAITFALNKQKIVSAGAAGGAAKNNNLLLFAGASFLLWQIFKK